MSTDWIDYVEANGKQKMYRCQKCGKTKATMKRRFVNEPSQSHNEYQIVCPCGNKGSVHWSRLLAERVFEVDGKD